jgi:DNA-binding XRE family transcriptional regulator
MMNTTENPKTRTMQDARRRLGLTQFDLARRVGCSESLVSKIETGRTTPEGWLKEAIARELGLRTWEIQVSLTAV